ncbi:unnamed protein product [Sphenostylis stenocarpa]|uniref:Uncharacterized protein n=1 Tax=Sphenostylis stenocarpa TaxID=92480 RepID=A0AA86W349_9FABA|nr:unnamed protein product [Sphenostylis stenocarpa]
MAKECHHSCLHVEVRKGDVSLHAYALLVVHSVECTVSIVRQLASGIYLYTYPNELVLHLIHGGPFWGQFHRMSLAMFLKRIHFTANQAKAPSPRAIRILRLSSSGNNFSLGLQKDKAMALKFARGLVVKLTTKCASKSNSVHFKVMVCNRKREIVWMTVRWRLAP